MVFYTGISHSHLGAAGIHNCIVLYGLHAAPQMIVDFQTAQINQRNKHIWTTAADCCILRLCVIR